MTRQLARSYFKHQHSWPSGLRRPTQVRISSDAWVQISPNAHFCVNSLSIFVWTWVSIKYKSQWYDRDVQKTNMSLQTKHYPNPKLEERLLCGSLTMFLFGWKLDTNFLYNCTYCDNRIDNYVDNNDTSMYMKELRMYL